MAHELVKVPFHGDELEATEDDKGTIWVNLRRGCDNFGLDFSSQLKKLRGKAWACVVEITTHDTTGREQSMIAISRESLPGWLFSIDARKVKGEVREKLAIYQKQCAQVLADYFLKRKTAAVAVPVPDPLPLLRQAVAEARHASAQMVEMREEMRVLLEEVNGVKLRMSVPLPPARDEYRDDSQRATDAAYAHVHGGMTQAAAARKYRVSERNVRYMAKVLREDASIATLVSWGRIAVKHAALALTLDPATRRKVAYTATAAADITAAARRRKKPAGLPPAG